MSGESYVNQLTGGSIDNTDVGYLAISSAVDVTLSYPTERILDCTFTAASKVLKLPPASNYSEGNSFIIANVGAQTFTIKDQSGSTSIQVAAVGSTYLVYIKDNSTSDGLWRSMVLGGGGAQAGANADITSLTGLTTPLSVGQGGTGLDGDVTGGSGQYVKQASLGGNFTVGTIPAADYPTMVGDAGAGGTKGAVPAPSAGDAAANKFLKADGTFAVPSGTGAGAAEAYVTIGNTAGLSAERALTGSSSLTVTDGGANSTVTLSVAVPLPATAANATNIPRVNAAATAIEYRTPAQTIGDLGTLVPDVQVFTANGTWTKPTNAKIVLVKLWGGGGGGGGAGVTGGSRGGGGGGGGYAERLFAASELSATESVVVGSGGAGGANTGASGAGGGTSDFGTGPAVRAFGGGGGFGQNANANSGGGGGGGITQGGSVGSATNGGDGGQGGTGATTSVAAPAVYGIGQGGGGGLGAASPVAAGAGAFASNGGGGGGGATDSSDNPTVGGNSIYGGAGGGAVDPSNGPRAGGTSKYGGNGGASASDATGTAGSTPGGGGGGTHNSGSTGRTGGAGARGEVRVYTW